jgi:transposase
VPAVPAWLTTPLWDQFAALLPARPAVDPTHPLGCHRGRIPDRIMFDKMLQVLRFGCSHEAIADTTCSATTIRNRRDEWIERGVFAQLKAIVLDVCDRIVGLVLERISVDGCITKAPGGAPTNRTITEHAGALVDLTGPARLGPLRETARPEDPTRWGGGLRWLGCVRLARAHRSRTESRLRLAAQPWQFGMHHQADHLSTGHRQVFSAAPVDVPSPETRPVRPGGGVRAC